MTNAASVIANGAVYALIALGFSFTFSASRTLNFAQGECIFASAVITELLIRRAGVDPVLAWAFAISISVLLSLAIAQWAVRPFVLSSHAGAGWLLATVAVGLVIRNLLELLTSRVERPLAIFGQGVVADWSIVVVSLVTVAVTFGILRRRPVLRLRLAAASESIEKAETVGIDTRAALYATYAIAGAFAGICGPLLAQRTSVSPWLGSGIAIRAFAAAVICRMRLRPVRLLATGVAIAIVEYVIAVRISPAWSALPGLALALGSVVTAPGVFRTEQQSIRA